MIDRLLTVLFTILLLALGWVLGVLGSVHGPANFFYFVLGCVVLAEALLWVAHWFIRKRGSRHGTLLIVAVGMLLVAALVGGSGAGLGLLVDWEVARQERLAVATQVFDVHDEPLLSAHGNPIGIRLRYSMRFPNSDYFWHTPSLRAGREFGVSLWADGRFTEPSVTPPMPAGKYGAPRYEQGRQYDFTADILPYFLTQSRDKSKLCIIEPPGEYRAGLERMFGAEAIRYKISINGTKFEGETRNAYSPKTFYESAVKEGAVKLEGSGLGGSVGHCE